MYWGKSGSADNSNSHAVFDTGFGFQAVWHLNEPGNSNSNGYMDATVHGVFGTGINIASGMDTAGLIGPGQNLIDSQYIFVGTTGVGGVFPRTISGWVKGNSLNGGRPTAFGYNPNTTVNATYFDFTGNAVPNYYVLYIRGGTNDITSAVSTGDKAWHFLAGAYDSTGTAYCYIDGALIGLQSLRQIPSIHSLSGITRGILQTNIFTVFLMKFESIILPVTPIGFLSCARNRRSCARCGGNPCPLPVFRTCAGRRW